MMKKKIISIVLCLSLLIAGIAIPTVVKAADGVVYEKFDNISTYRADKSAPTKPGYVFAGWYSAENENAALSETGADAAANTSGAYAKFVDEDVLSVKCQITAGTTNQSDKTALRMVTTVDNLKYRAVGFDITLGTATGSRMANKVYKTIAGFANNKLEYYQPTIFSVSSDFFMSYVLSDITNSYFDTQISIVPKWETLDGTVVRGMKKSFKINEVLQTTLTLIKETTGTAEANWATTLVFAGNDKGYNGNQLFHYHLTSDDLLNESSKAVKSVKLYLKLLGGQNSEARDDTNGSQPLVILQLNEDGTGKVEFFGSNVTMPTERILTTNEVSEFQKAMGTTGLDMFITYHSEGETFEVYIGTTYVGSFTGEKYQSGGYVNNVNVYLVNPGSGKTSVSGVDAEIKEYAYTGETADAIDSLLNTMAATSVTLVKEATGTAITDKMMFTDVTGKNGNQLFQFHLTSNELLDENDQAIKSAKIYLKLFGGQSVENYDEKDGHQPVVILHLYHDNGEGKVEFLGTKVTGPNETGPNVNGTNVNLSKDEVAAFQKALGTDGLDVFMAYHSATETVDVYIGTTYIGQFTGSNDSNYKNGYMHQARTLVMPLENGRTGITNLSAEVKEYAYTGNVSEIISDLQIKNSSKNVIKEKNGIIKYTESIWIDKTEMGWNTGKLLFHYRLQSDDMIVENGAIKKSAKIMLKLYGTKVKEVEQSGSNWQNFVAIITFDGATGTGSVELAKQSDGSYVNKFVNLTAAQAGEFGTAIATTGLDMFMVYDSYSERAKVYLGDTYVGTVEGAVYDAGYIYQSQMALMKDDKYCDIQDADYSSEVYSYDGNVFEIIEEFYNSITLVKNATGTAKENTPFNFYENTTGYKGNQLFQFHLTSDELLDANNSVVKNAKIYMKLWGGQSAEVHDADNGHQPVVILQLNQNGSGKVELTGSRNTVTATTPAVLSTEQISSYQRLLGTTGLDVFMAYHSATETVDVYIGTTYIGTITGINYKNGYVNQMWTQLLPPEQGTGVSGVTGVVKEYSYTGSVDKIINKFKAVEPQIVVSEVASGTPKIDCISGTITRTDSSSDSIVYFDGCSQTWEVTGTMKQENLSALVLQGFAVRGREGSNVGGTSCYTEAKAVQYYGHHNGFVATNSWNWGYNNLTNEPTAQAGPAKYYVFNETAHRYFKDDGKRTATEIDFRLVLVEDTLYFWINDVLSWRIPLTATAFGGYEAGSIYDIGIAIKGDNKAGTVIFENLKVKYGIEADTSGTLNFVAKESNVDVVDELAGLIERTDSSKVQKLSFAGADANSRATKWEVSGTMYRKNINENVMMGFTVGNGEQTVKFLGQSKGFVYVNAADGWSFDYNNPTNANAGSYVLESTSEAFFGDTKTAYEIDFRALIVDDVLYVYFNDELSWKIPLTSDSFGGFNAGTSYEFGVMFNNQDVGTAGFKDLKVKSGNEILTDADFFIRDPYILADNGTYYLYGSRFGGSFDVLTSKDLITWEKQKPCFVPDDNFWGIKSDYWAPEVHKYKNPDNNETAYYMLATFNGYDDDEYASPRKRGTAILKADSPLGPFTEWSVDSENENIYGPVTLAGKQCLDGTLYIEDGVPYMIFCYEWSNEGANGNGKMYYVQLSNDLKKALGKPVFMFQVYTEWLSSTPGLGITYRSEYGHNGVTDGPQIYKATDGTLLLLWSNYVSLNKDGKYVYSQLQLKSSTGKLDGAKWTWDNEHAFLYGITEDSSDGGHGMIFTDFKGNQRLILHTPCETDTGWKARHRILDVTFDTDSQWLKVVSGF